MKRLNLFFFLFFITISLFGQYSNDQIIKGVLLDYNSQKPLIYANIYPVNATNTGVITNEEGQYALDVSNFSYSDSIRFQYMGYKTQQLALSELIHSPDVYLQEDIINISETLVFGREVDPLFIVEQVLLNADINYDNSRYSYMEVFVRERYDLNILRFKLDYKKSSISDIDKNTLYLAEQNIPIKSISYTDFLGDLLLSPIDDDGIRMKMESQRVVSLKDKEINEVDQLTGFFEKAFKATDSLEYWKIKTGIIGSKIEMNFSDSALNLEEDEKEVRSFARNLYYDLNDCAFENKSMWDFLYKTSRYEFSFFGGTRLNGEDIYIIDFSPIKKGKYQGRLYIALSSYALLRADFQYAEGKHGKNIDMLGINYNQESYKISLSFENVNSVYQLKYFSKKKGFTFGIDRNISLLKKKKRKLFNQTLLELKSGLDMQVRNQHSFEFFVLSNNVLSEKDYLNFEEKKKMKVIYLDQFDDNLWKGYDILEPTHQMREYKKNTH